MLTGFRCAGGTSRVTAHVIRCGHRFYARLGSGREQGLNRKKKSGSLPNSLRTLRHYSRPAGRAFRSAGNSRVGSRLKPQRATSWLFVANRRPEPCSGDPNVRQLEPHWRMVKTA